MYNNPDRNTLVPEDHAAKLSLYFETSMGCAIVELEL